MSRRAFGRLPDHRQCPRIGSARGLGRPRHVSAHPEEEGSQPPPHRPQQCTLPR